MLLYLQMTRRGRQKDLAWLGEAIQVVETNSLEDSMTWRAGVKSFEK
jgi:hypothetical protein